MPIPPLVAPGPALSAERAARYARTVQLPGFGPLAQRRLRAARVLVVGAGGLGSAVLPLLVSTGFGTVGIVDDDRVETSNLPRQTLHGPADVGRLKVDSAVEALRPLDEETHLLVLAERLVPENVERILADVDLVLDGSDNFPTRYLVNDAAVRAGKPVVWGAVHQAGGQVGVSWAAHGPHYRDLFPVPPEPGSIPSCAEAGVLPSVCGVIGAAMVGEAVKVVTGVGEPLIGRAMVYDALKASIREVRYERDPAAPPIDGPLGDEGTPGDSAAVCAAGAVSAGELHARLAAGEPHTLLDVREPWEADIARIPGSVQVTLDAVVRDPSAVAARLGAGQLVLVCHRGVRAETARRLLAEAGRPGLILAGGIDAWSREVDPSLPRY